MKETHSIVRGRKYNLSATCHFSRESHVARRYLLLNECRYLCFVRGVTAFYRRRRAHVADSRLHTINGRRFPHSTHSPARLDALAISKGSLPACMHALGKRAVPPVCRRVNL